MHATSKIYNGLPKISSSTQIRSISQFLTSNVLIKKKNQQYLQEYT